MHAQAVSFFISPFTIPILDSSGLLLLLLRLSFYHLLFAFSKACR